MKSSYALLFATLVGSTAMAQTLTDADSKTLVQLKEAGSNLSKPHKIDHWLYFPSQKQAEAAAADLRGKDFAVASIEKGKTEWRVLAQRTMAPTPANVAATTASLEAIAASHKGDYDGWGTEVVE